MIKNAIFSSLWISLIIFSNLAAQPSLKWAKSYGGKSYENSFDVEVDFQGNVYSVGTFTGKCDFNPGSDSFFLTPFNTKDIFILKLNAVGGFVWAKSFKCGGGGEAYSLKLDSVGNVYCAGAFAGLTDFDPGAGVSNLLSKGVFDAFIAKLDKDGNFKWVKRFGGIQNDVAYSLSIDKRGNIYSTGYFSDSCDFDPGTKVYKIKSKGNSDIFIHKLNSAGDFVWVKGVGNTSYEQGNAITIDKNYNVITTGYFNQTVDFDPAAATYNLTSNGFEDFFISKLDSNGNFMWAISAGGSISSDIGKAVVTDNNDNIYSVGAFWGSSDFDPGTGSSVITSKGRQDVFVQKLDKAGNFGWVKSFGGSEDDDGKSLAIDNYDKIYMTGTFKSKVDFNTGVDSFYLQSAGEEDCFISALDTNGVHLSSYRYGGKSFDFSTSIACDNEGNIFSTGHYTDTADLDPSSLTRPFISVGKTDNYALKFSNCDVVATISKNGSFLIANEVGDFYQWVDCDKNNAPIIGEIAKSYKPKVKGNYAVIVYRNNCADTSDCMAYLNIENVKGKSDIIVFPNPASKTITFSNINECNILIYDLTGKVVFTGSLEANNYTISIEHLIDGLYTIQLFDFNQIFVSKIIVVNSSE